MSRLAPPLLAENYLDVLALQKKPTNIVAFYRTILQKSEKKLRSSFNKDSNVVDLVRTRAWYVEQILLALWQENQLGAKLALVAVGGFGRGDLHPYSDVDILLLKPNNTKKYDVAISQFIQNLWDIGLDIGSAVRTAKECYEQARDDVTIATNLMEALYIFSNKILFATIQISVSTRKIWSAQDFYQAKISEQKARH
ncbi:MAG TPA: [protein-PII] uridylyltransferase, partial [Oceanospirillales bacterium]|nr:[protein-PII] uridylyltransferase [Oceanospirillales bacterium]